MLTKNQVDGINKRESSDRPNLHSFEPTSLSFLRGISRAVTVLLKLMIPDEKASQGCQE